MGKILVRRASRKVEDVIVGATCDCCGKEGVPESYASGKYLPENFWPIVLDGGWSSTFPTDLSRLSIVVCSDCLERWVKSFKHPVEPVGFGPGASGGPREVIDSETGATLVVQWGWLRPPDAPQPEEDAGALDCWPDVEPAGIHRHFKGNLYEVVEVVLHHETRELHVVYTALHGESLTYVRPLQMWEEHVERDGYSGPRFRFEP